MAKGFGRSRSRRPKTRDRNPEPSSSEIQHWGNSQANQTIAAVTTTVDAMPPPPSQGLFRSRSRSKSRKSVETLRPLSRDEPHLYPRRTSPSAAKGRKRRPSAPSPFVPSDRPPVPLRQPTAQEDIGMALGSPREDSVVLAPPPRCECRRPSDATRGPGRSRKESDVSQSSSAWTGSSATTQDGQPDAEICSQVEPKISRWKSFGGMFSKKTTPAHSPKTQFFLAHHPSPIFEYEPPDKSTLRTPPTPPASPPEAKPRPSFMGRSRAASKASLPPSRAASPAPTKDSSKPPRKKTLKRLRRPPVPKPAPLAQEQIPDLQFWTPPTLDVEIPSVKMERYSVMFGSLLNARDRSSLLVRRQAHVDKLEKLDRLNPILEVRPKSSCQVYLVVQGLHHTQADSPLTPPHRPASSPPATGKQSPTFSLFPATPSSISSTAGTERDRSRGNPGPSPLSRATAPPSHSTNSPRTAMLETQEQQRQQLLHQEIQDSMMRPFADNPTRADTPDSFVLTIQSPPDESSSTQSRTASRARRPSPSPPRLTAFPPQPRAGTPTHSSRASSKTRRPSVSPQGRITISPQPEQQVRSQTPPETISTPTPPASQAVSQSATLPAAPLLAPREPPRRPSPKPHSNPPLSDPRPASKRNSYRQARSSRPSQSRSPTRPFRPQRPQRPPPHQRPPVNEPFLTEAPPAPAPAYVSAPTHAPAQVAAPASAPAPAPAPMAAPSPEPSPLEVTQSAAELSIARQISVSQRQRAAIKMTIPPSTTISTATANAASSGSGTPSPSKTAMIPPSNAGLAISGEHKALTPTLVEFGDGGMISVGERRVNNRERARETERERQRMLAMRRSEVGVLETA